MKKSTKYALWGFGITAGVIGGIIAFNRIISNNAVSNDYLSVPQSGYYNYSQGKVFYSKSGSGSPVLLVNSIYGGYGTGYEYSRLEKILSKEHTVYTMDLLGTGRSDKPAMIYTNFMFAQMINGFIRDIIGEAADVVVSGESSSFAVMGAVMNEGLYRSLTMLNPEEISKTSEYTSSTDKVKYFVEASPVLGSLLYTIAHSHNALRLKLVLDGFSNTDNLFSYDKASFYKAAFLKNGAGKYLVASMHANYTHINIRNGLSKLTIPMKVIATDNYNSAAIAHEYQQTNHRIETVFIDHTKSLVALEAPVALYHALEF